MVDEADCPSKHLGGSFFGVSSTGCCYPESELCVRCYARSLIFLIPTPSLNDSYD